MEDNLLMVLVRKVNQTGGDVSCQTSPPGVRMQPMHSGATSCHVLPPPDRQGAVDAARSRRTGALPLALPLPSAASEVGD